MDKERFSRYQDKIYHIEQRMENLSEWENEDHVLDLFKLATYKAIQEVFEGLTDILAMLVKDLGLKSKDDYANIQICFDKSIISEKDKNILNEGNGLRNRLVHSYNGLNDRIAIESTYRLMGGVDDIIRSIQIWLEK